MGFLSLFVAGALTAMQMVSYPQWGALRPGIHGVGFEMISEIEPSRPYVYPDGVQHGRPMRAYVWYPAATTSGQQMHFEDYFERMGSELGESSTAWRDYHIREMMGGPMAPVFPNGISEADRTKILTAQVAARANATPSPGRHPLVLMYGGLFTQSVMAEYLASHGYVVLVTPQMGTSSASYGRGDGNPANIDHQVMDVDWMLRKADQLAYANTDWVASVGMFAQTGWLHHLVSSKFDALACLDCSFEPTVLRGRRLPATAANIPTLYWMASENVQRSSLADSLAYAEVYRPTANDISHYDFYPFRNVGNPGSVQMQPYERLCQATLAFLENVRGNKEGEVDGLTRAPASKGTAVDERKLLTAVRFGDAAAFETLLKENTSRSNMPREPLLQSFLFLTRDASPQALAILDVFRANFPDDERISIHYYRLGTTFHQMGNMDEARKVLERYATHFPASPFPFYGLSKVHFSLGETDEAHKAATKALSLLDTVPMNEQQREGIRRELQTHLR